MKAPREPVMFERMFIGLSGVVYAASGFYLTLMGIWRLWNPAPTPLPLPRPLTVAFTLGFLASAPMVGIGLVMIALSRRLWNRI